MRTLALLFITALALLGQQESQAKPEAAQQAAEQKPEAKPEAKPETPDYEKVLTGSIDVGYRFRTGVSGDFNTYRSVVNLGEGPALLGADFTYTPGNSKWMDRLRVLVDSWGPEPFRTARFDLEKQSLYRLRVDYRDLKYFNFLPSFANPLAGAGSLATQHGFDISRRSSDAELTLFPLGRFVPYVAWSRGSGDGRGVADLVLSRNEYVLPTRIYDRADNVRGGVRIEFSRFHVTLEQGFVNYRDDQELFAGNVPNSGNVTTPVFGQRLFLNGAYQALGVRGDSPFTRGMFTASPFSWINVNGAFLFSQPDTKASFAQAASGLVTNGSALFAGQLLLANSRSVQPHPSGSLSVELKPFSRLRIFESFMTDRLHTAAEALLTETLFSGTSSQVLSTPGLERLVTNYNQNEINVLFDVLPRLTLRGGHRYVWGDSDVPPSIAANSIGLERQFGEVKRQAGLAGLTWRTRDKLSFSFDYEGAASDASYFRTSLHDYQRARIQARYQLLASLQLSARFNYMDNSRPRPDYPAAGPTLDYHFRSRDNNASLYWNPDGGKRLSLLVDYSRSTFNSETDYLAPNTLQSELSEYRERAHTATALIDIPIPARAELQPKFTFGGSFFRSAGTRPVKFYQPTAKIAVPLYKHVQWNLDWRWHGLSQPFYLYEGFRTHTFVTGFRFSM